MSATNRLLLAGAGIAAAGYASYVAATFFRYGRPEPLHPDDADPLLDRFIPIFDVAERHHIRVAAPAETTLAAASRIDLSRSPIIRAVFKGRELIMGSHPEDRPQPSAFLDQMQAIGWGILAEVPGREIVVGAVTKPWQADVTFRALPPEAFAAFQEPDYAKIVWTLRADPIDAGTSMFRTETRVATTDEAARAKFRWYWSCLSPGIRLIRLALLVPVKREAEAQARLGAPAAAAV